MSRNKAKRCYVKRVTLLLIGFLISSSAFANVFIEQWLQPSIQIKTSKGEWQMKSVDTLPVPPIAVVREKGSLVQIKLRRVGFVWIPRTSVRLSEESLLLMCQKTATAKAGDYQTYGMRGEEKVPFTCIAK